MSAEQKVNSYQHILDYLYDKYYKCFSEHSDVTSSHWRTVGKQRVLKKNRRYNQKLCLRD